MSTALLAAAAEILPFALVIAVSPISLLATILTLFSARASQNGPAFLIGWVLGLALTSAAALRLIEVGEQAYGGSPSVLASAGRSALGAVLLAVAGRQWRKRRQAGGSLPKWMTAIAGFSPLKAGAAGFLLSGLANPKNLLLVMAASMSISQAGLAWPGMLKLIAVFVAGASLGVLMPVAYCAFGGAAAKRVLKTWQLGLLRHNAVVMALMLLAFGVFLLIKGLGGLMG
jgi:hypothetical protein